MKDLNKQVGGKGTLFAGVCRRQVAQKLGINRRVDPHKSTSFFEHSQHFFTIQRISSYNPSFPYPLHNSPSKFDLHTMADHYNPYETEHSHYSTDPNTDAQTAAYEQYQDLTLSAPPTPKNQSGSADPYYGATRSALHDSPLTLPLITALQHGVEHEAGSYSSYTASPPNLPTFEPSFLPTSDVSTQLFKPRIDCSFPTNPRYLQPTYETATSASYHEPAAPPGNARKSMPSKQSGILTED